MTTAIRYYSKFGHSTQMAEVVGQVAGAKPMTVDTPLSEPVDVLYLGTGVLFGKIHKEMENYIRTLTPDKVKRVVCFGSCAIIPSPVPQMSKLLASQGITVDQRSFTCRGAMGPLHKRHPDKQDLDNLRKFVQTTI